MLEEGEGKEWQGKLLKSDEGESKAGEIEWRGKEKSGREESKCRRKGKWEGRHISSLCLVFYRTAGYAEPLWGWDE